MPLRQVKLQNLRTIGIPCLYKSYKIPQTRLRCVPFPAPAYRPVEGNSLFGWISMYDLADGVCPSADKTRVHMLHDAGPGPQEPRREHPNSLLAFCLCSSRRRLELDGDFCFHLDGLSIHYCRFVLALPGIFQGCGLQRLRTGEHRRILHAAIGADQSLHAHCSLYMRGLGSRRINQFRLRD